jgi:hypothetical protein
LRDLREQDQERRAEYELGLRLIDIGFKALSKQLRQLCGSQAAKTRLKRARNRLKQNA